MDIRQAAPQNTYMYKATEIVLCILHRILRKEWGHHIESDCMIHCMACYVCAVTTDRPHYHYFCQNLTSNYFAMDMG